MKKRELSKLKHDLLKSNEMVNSRFSKGEINCLFTSSMLKLSIYGRRVIECYTF